MKLGWYYHRLRAMTPSEVAHRVTDRWRHASDACFADSLHAVQIGEAARGVVPLPAREHAPEKLKQVLAQDAAALKHGDWKLFGWREMNVGTPPHWHRDPAFRVDTPPGVLAHRLDHRTLPSGADARTIWEINRWSEMVRLAMHGRLNGDVETLYLATGWLEDWHIQNPVGYGINWTSPLEAGLRLINYVWFDLIVEDALDSVPVSQTGCREMREALKLAQHTLSQQIVPAHAAWIWRYRSFGSSANNHLLGELVGLLHAVKRWPALESVICPAEQLWQRISACVLEQFAGDGGNKEQALHYHLFAWEMAWHAARLMRVTRGSALDRLHSAAAFFTHMAHESEQWEYGDNDDAQIVPLALHRENAVAEWREWMLGAEGVNDGSAIGYWLGSYPEELRGASPDASQWFVAPQSGMAACEHDGWKLRFDASPLGFGKLSAHGHGDALHVSIWDGPHALVIDPGTGGYFGAKELRAKLAAWEAHNGPQPVAGYLTPKRAGVFLWMGAHAHPFIAAKGPEARAQYWHEGHEFERAVHVAEPGLIEITDRHFAGGPLRTRWHFAPECKVSLSDATPGQILIQRDSQQWSARFSCDGDSCQLSLSEGTASRAYGRTETCPVLEVTGVGTIHAEWRRITSARH